MRRGVQSPMFGLVALAALLIAYAVKVIVFG